MVQTFRHYLSSHIPRVKHSSWTDWPLMKGPIGSLETSVSSHETLRNNPEDERPLLTTVKYESQERRDIKIKSNKGSNRFSFRKVSVRQIPSYSMICVLRRYRQCLTTHHNQKVLTLQQYRCDNPKSLTAKQPACFWDSLYDTGMARGS
jgi:hypothetical protein